MTIIRCVVEKCRKNKMGICTKDYVLINDKLKCLSSDCPIGNDT